MAGLGSRFSKAGYQKPKPFIDVNDLPMISRVLDNLSYPEAHYYLIAQRKHLEQEPEVVEKIRSRHNTTFIPIDGLTEGTACTVLFARKYINNGAPLLIANSDQIVELEIQKFINDCENRHLDGSILCFEDKNLDPKWSFAKTNDTGFVIEVQEKKAISNNATVGIYLFSRGSDFVDATIDMIIANDRVNNEFYTCPVYNYLIKEGKEIGIYNIDFKQMHGLGTPGDLTKYIKLIS